MYDLFISHAWQDKNDLVRPLAERLERLGARVWYDEFTLGIGDSLRQSLDKGLAESRFGIVVFSPSFFAKSWTQYELNGLVNRQVDSRQKVILPIWHRIGKKEISKHSPSLSDLIAVRSDGDINGIAKRLVNELGLGQPYLQLSGQQIVKPLPEDLDSCEWRIERTLQVGANPLRHIQFPVLDSSENEILSASPGTAKYVLIGGERHFGVTFDPPISPDSVSTQQLTVLVKGCFADREIDNITGRQAFIKVQPRARYSCYILQVELPQEGLAYDFRGMEIIESRPVELDEGALEVNGAIAKLTIKKPVAGPIYCLAWNWRD